MQIFVRTPEYGYGRYFPSSVFDVQTCLLPMYGTKSVETISKKEAEEEVERFMKDTKESTKFFKISSRIGDKQNFEVVD